MPFGIFIKLVLIIEYNFYFQEEKSDALRHRLARRESGCFSSPSMV